VIWLIAFCIGMAWLIWFFARYEEQHRRVCALCEGKRESEDGIPCPLCSRRTAA
jgi:hypothetical protein